MCSLDTINPSVQVSNQISLWQALGDYPRVLWALTAGPVAPGKQHRAVTVALLLLAACLSLAGPQRAAQPHGPPLSWPAHCAATASRGMYGQDGTLHFSQPGKRENGESGESWALVRRLLVDRGRATSCCLCCKNHRAVESKAAELREQTQGWWTELGLLFFTWRGFNCSLVVDSRESKGQRFTKMSNLQYSGKPISRSYAMSFKSVQ